MIEISTLLASIISIFFIIIYITARPVSHTIKYITTVSDKIDKNIAAEFAAKVDAVLNDPRGWRKHGYTFIRQPSINSLRIRLETSEDADNLCGTHKLSCWRGGPHDIIIHLGNWMGESNSKLSIDRYRNYVISHEVGHELGLSHQKCPSAECEKRGMKECPASIMQQMTRGPSFVAPCLENDWPLDPDWDEDNPDRLYDLKII